MSRSRLLQSGRQLARSSRPINASRQATCALYARPQASLRLATSTNYRFSTCAIRRKGIMPETDSPSQPSSSTANPPATLQPAELSESQYHELADIYLDHALGIFEEIQDQKDELDVEYSSGVMTISVPGKGTYVLNKQPPNKQIWLSSPISGPKRYDWCVVGDGQADKEGTASGNWIYTRDGSTLSGLILEELDVDLEAPDTD